MVGPGGRTVSSNLSKDDLAAMDPALAGLLEAAKQAEAASAKAAANFQLMLEENLAKKRRAERGAVPGRDDAERIRREADEAARQAAEEAMRRELG